jgi:hypothetical protein
MVDAVDWQHVFVSSTCAISERTIPSQCFFQFKEALSPVLALLAGPVLDPALVERAWKVFFLFPRWVLGVVSRHGKGGRKAAAALRVRLKRFMAGEWQALEDESIRAAREQQLASSSSPSSPTAATIKRAEVLASVGEFSRAAQVLYSSSTLLPAERGTLEARAAKHPPRSSELPPLPHQPAEPLFDLGTFTEVVEHLPRAIASDMSGWRYEHFTAISQCGLEELLFALAHRVATTASLPAGLVPFFAGATLLPLSKPDGDVRPVAVGTTLRRVIGRVVAAVHKEAFAEFFSPLQVGVAVPGGGELPAHAVRAALAANPTWAYCEVDSTNAFNSISRAAMAAAVGESFPALAPLYALCHAPIGHLRVRLPDGNAVWLPSQEGAQQGDALGSFFFALGLQPLLKQVREQHPDVLVVAYLDNVGLLGPPAATSAAAASLLHLMASINLTANLVKSFVFSPTTLPTELFPGFSRHEEGVLVLGVPVGGAAFQEQFVGEQFERIVTTAQKALSLVSKQLALFMFRYCVASRPVFLLRTVPPAFTAAASARLDGEAHVLLSQLIGVAPLPPLAMSQAALPLRVGGLGITAAVDTGTVAFAASWAFFSAVQPAMFPLLTPLLALPGFAASTVGEAAEAACALVKSAISVQVEGGLVRVDDVSVLAKIQKKMAVTIASKRQASLLAAFAASEQDRARLVCASADSANGWLIAIPSTPELALPNDLFSIALTTLLGVPPAVALPQHCVCGKPIDALGVHLSSCMHKGGAILRHDCVVAALHQLALAAGKVVRKELSHVVDGRRLDLVLFDAEGITVVDVEVMYPLAASHVKAAAKKSLVTCEKGESGKRREHEAECQRKGLKFTPAVWESFGGCTKGTEELVTSLVSGISDWDSVNWAARLPGQYWRQRLSVCIQRYSAFKIQVLARASAGRGR